MSTPEQIDRRAVLRGACAVCVGVAGAGVLAACGGGSGSDSGSGSSTPTAIKTSDIPVGGGKVFARQTFLVGNVQGGTINCLHHGSMYHVSTSAVVGGPAPAPLAAKTVTVNGDTLTVT